MDPLGRGSTLELTVTVKGTDADILVPQTIAGSALFKVAAGGEVLSEETFVAFTIMAVKCPGAPVSSSAK